MPWGSGCSIVAAVVTGLLALGLPVAARAATFTEVVPFSYLVENPCNGDMVAVTGTMKIVTVTNNHKVELQTNWPDTSGLALDGTRYQANDVSHLYVFSVPSGALTVGLHDSFELVSQDGSSNFLVHMNESITFDLVTGEMTTKLSGPGAECSGS
jgi:hypothetical protein